MRRCLYLIPALLLLLAGCGGSGGSTATGPGGGGGGGGSNPGTTNLVVHVDVGPAAGRELLARFPDTVTSLTAVVFLPPSQVVSGQSVVREPGSRGVTFTFPGLSPQTVTVRVLGFENTLLVGYADQVISLVDGADNVVTLDNLVSGPPPSGPGSGPSVLPSPSPEPSPQPSVGPSPTPTVAPSPAPSPAPTTSPSPVAVVSITIDPASAQVTELSNFQFKLVAHLATGLTMDVTNLAVWSSSQSSIAALLSPGLFKALNLGSTTIKAELEGKSAEAKLQVVSLPGPIVPPPDPKPEPTPKPPPKNTTLPLIYRLGTNGDLRRIDGDGNNVNPVPYVGAANLGNDVRRLGQIEFDAAGNLYIPEASARIQKVTPAGVGTLFATGAAGGDFESCAFGKDGNLYAASNDGTIQRFSPTGTAMGTLATGLPALGGMRVDPDGNFFVGCADGTVRAFQPDGTPLASFGTAGVVTVGITVTNVYMLCFDATYNIFVASDANGKVRKISSDGATVTDVANGGIPYSGMAIDKDGNRYMAVIDGRITRTRPDGTVNTISAPGSVLALTLSPP